MNIDPTVFGGVTRYMLFNVNTRRLLPGRMTATHVEQAEECAANVTEDGSDTPDGSLSYVLGWWENADSLWVDYDGNVVARNSKSPPLVKPEPYRDPPTLADIKAEAARRIETKYPIWKQLNFLSEAGGDALSEMTAYISAVRTASNELEKKSPIPTNFQDPEFWP